MVHSKAREKASSIKEIIALSKATLSKLMYTCLDDEALFHFMNIVGSFFIHIILAPFVDDVETSIHVWRIAWVFDEMTSFGKILEDVISPRIEHVHTLEASTISELMRLFKINWRVSHSNIEGIRDVVDLLVVFSDIMVTFDDDLDTI